MDCLTDIETEKILQNMITLCLESGVCGCNEDIPDTVTEEKICE